MISIDTIVAAYVAVWNEADPEQRRRRIASVWAADGTSCYRLLDARGPAEIEQRVASAWEKFLSEGMYRFRPRRASSLPGAIMSEWEMIRLADGAIEANGLSFLLHDANGRLRHDFQFNPSANDAADLNEQYVAVLNEHDPARRDWLIAEIFAPDAILHTPIGTYVGHGGISDGLTSCIGHPPGSGRFVPGDLSQRHHQVARLSWRYRDLSEKPAGAEGTHLLVFGADERIAEDFVFITKQIDT